MINLVELEQYFLDANARRESARLALFNATENVISASFALADAENATRLSGVLTGTNEPARKAQLETLLTREIEELRFCEAAERKARYEFGFADAEYDLCRHRLKIADIATHQ